MEKLCVFCKYFDWERVEYTYYSTLTGGDLNGGATCVKGHYREENVEDTEAFRVLILKAETCKEYDHA